MSDPGSDRSSWRSCALGVDRADRRPAEVHQATGMITVQLGVRLAGALLRLRAHAYDSGQTVTDVAAEVVNRRLRFDDSEPDSTTADR